MLENNSSVISLFFLKNFKIKMLDIKKYRTEYKEVLDSTNQLHAAIWKLGDGDDARRCALLREIEAKERHLRNIKYIVRWLSLNASSSQ